MRKKNVSGCLASGSDNIYDLPCWQEAKYRHPGGDSGARRLAELERYYRRCGEGCFLNVCCGDGSGMEWFRDYDGRCYGVDSSEILLARAQEQFPEYSFIYCDVKKGLPFPAHWAAAALCECSLSLFGSERWRVTEEIYRILKPGGLLLLADVTWQQDEPPEGFQCLTYEEHPDWIKEFISAWLWTNGSLPPLSHRTDKVPGYFLGVYRRCD